MSEELEKTRKALDIALGSLDKIAETDTMTEGLQVARMIRERVATILDPPPEYEYVEVVRWYNIYPLTGGFHLDCTHGFATKEEADNDAGTERIGCQDIRVKVKRPVRRAVVREYEVAAKVTAEGDARGIDHGCPFHAIPECHGKAGVLIFRTAE